ncbi:MAG: glycosyltransferase family 4 protein, partial [bacterium]
CIEFGIQKERMIELYYFLPPNILNSVIENKIAGGEEEYLLYYGRLSKEKGVDLIIKAMEKIENKKIKLKIAGVGPDSLSLKKLVKETGQSARIQFVGWKSGNDLRDIIGGAKAVIMPSVWPDNMPFCMLESLAQGKVVIASRVGGMPEIVKDNENGFLFSCGDYFDLAKKLNKLDKADLSAMSRKSKETARVLNEENFYQELMKHYRSLL